MQSGKGRTDRVCGNMLLHSCTLYIEGCALEYRIQRDQAKYFLIRDASAERARDDAERRLASDRGLDIPLPLDDDRLGAAGDASEDSDDCLIPHGWPIWLRQRSAVAETFAITSFRAPGGVDLPTWLWVTAIPELRTIILSINDVLSFCQGAPCRRHDVVPRRAHKGAPPHRHARHSAGRGLVFA